MDYINIKNFEIRRGRSINDLSDWIPYTWLENRQPVSLVLPPCDKKYWKVVNNEIKEMSISEKNTVDTTEELEMFNNRSRQDIIRDIRSALGDDLKSIRLLNKYPTLVTALDGKDWVTSRMIIDLAVSDGELLDSEATTIKNEIPS